MSIRSDGATKRSYIIAASGSIYRIVSGSWSMRRTAIAAATVIISLCFAAPALRAAELQPLEIVTATGGHKFSIEVATTPEEQAKGLMFRRELPEMTGMLFNFQTDQEVAFWMENTFISLDLIFINADGRIRRIAENAEPMSKATIPSGGPVRAVLEVIGGTTRKLGIKEGDRVVHPIFAGR
jgi:uncharacterized membrane protein (UPF0127 family)